MNLGERLLPQAGSARPIFSRLVQILGVQGLHLRQRRQHCGRRHLGHRREAEHVQLGCRAGFVLAIVAGGHRQLGGRRVQARRAPGAGRGDLRMGSVNRGRAGQE